LGAGFIFHPWVHPKPEKTRKSKETHKNLKPENLPKKLKTQKNSFTKPDEHPNPTQNPMGSDSGAKFHPQVRVSNSI
jgi:hypothetical protein